MNEIFMEKAKEMAKLLYSYSVSRDETTDGAPILLVENDELQGCMAQGETIEEALANLEDARIDYMYSLLEDGLDIPFPEHFNTITSGEAENFDEELTMPSDGSSFLINSDRVEDDNNFSRLGRFAIKT